MPSINVLENVLIGSSDQSTSIQLQIMSDRVIPVKGNDKSPVLNETTTRLIPRKPKPDHVCLDEGGFKVFGNRRD
eukprot:363766-Karenia_brevis.AAC.1